MEHNQQLSTASVSIIQSIPFLNILKENNLLFFSIGTAKSSNFEKETHNALMEIETFYKNLSSAQTHFLNQLIIHLIYTKFLQSTLTKEEFESQNLSSFEGLVILLAPTKIKNVRHSLIKKTLEKQ